MAARASDQGWVYRIGWLLGRMIIWFLAISVLWVLLYRFVPPPVTFTMIGNKIDGYAIEKDWRRLDEIDSDVARAVIAAEDAKFCSHAGFDAEAIEKAFRYNARGGRIRGGSTISQQVAKNAFLWQGGGYFRKGLEAWFTVLVETIWGKRRIMEVYLNIAETGMGTYGAEAGARRYFGHSASQMSAAEAGRLAAVLPDPKDREAVNPNGFVRRYGNMIAARAETVRVSGLDACIR
jgi:monofunctional glycosyltransferase